MMTSIPIKALPPWANKNKPLEVSSTEEKIIGTKVLPIGDTGKTFTVGMYVDKDGNPAMKEIFEPELIIDQIPETIIDIQDEIDEAIAEDNDTNELPLVIDDQDDIDVNEYCRLYKADKYAPYQIMSDKEAIGILKHNIHNVVKRFKESSPNANDQRELADKYIQENDNKTRNLNYFDEDHSVRSIHTGFLSMWKYNKKELTAWMNSHRGKVEGFRGSNDNNQVSISTDFYYFDFDSALGMMNTLSRIIPLLDNLSEKDVKFRLFTSGSKGWHLYIHKSYFSIPDNHKNDPHTFINKYIARYIIESYKMYDVETITPMATDDTTIPLSQVGKTITTKKSFVDTDIYNAVNAFRMPFSRNEKTDFIKREFYYVSTSSIISNSKSSLVPKTLDTILLDDHLIYVPNNTHLFEALLTSLLIPDDTINPTNKIWMTLTEDMFVYNLKDNTKESLITTSQQSTSKYTHPMYEKVCIYNILNDRNPAERRNTALRLMSYWKDKMYTPRMIHANLQAWNAGLSNPCTKAEISKVMNAYESVSYTICKDKLCLQYCPMNGSCVYNKTRTFQDNMMVTSSGAIQEWRDFANMDLSAVTFLGDIYKGNTIRMYPKEISAVVAGSGVGKSVAVLDVILQSCLPYSNGGSAISDDYINVLLSNEMNTRQVVHRIAKKYGLDLYDPNDQRAYQTLTKNLVIIQDNTPVQLLYDKIMGIQDRMKKKVKMVGMDYFGIQRCYYPSTTKLITDGVGRADVLADLLPEFVRQIDAHLFFCCQPTKAVQGGGMVPLTDESPKAGQAVQALAGQIFSMWRPCKDQPLADHIMSHWVVKNRDGELTDFLDYHWHGASYTIGDLLKDKYGSHKAPITLKNE